MDSTKYLYKEIGAQSKLAYQLKTSYGTHSNPSSILYTILHMCYGRRCVAGPNKN